MKRIQKVILFTLITGLLPFSIAFGQVKKSEQKIKIVVSDDSGTKVIMDTLIKGGNDFEPVILKDGKAVFIASDKNDINLAGDKHLVVTVSTDGDETTKTVKEITVTGPDTIVWNQADSKGEKVIIIKDGKEIESNGGDSFSWVMKSGNSDAKQTDSEKTKYVIKKDGMVISIEGENYDRVKELAKVIEEKIDESGTSKEKKSAVKK